MIQIYPKKGMSSIFLFWGWDWDHWSCYTREGSRFLRKDILVYRKWLKRRKQKWWKWFINCEFECLKVFQNWTPFKRDLHGKVKHMITLNSFFQHSTTKWYPGSPKTINSRVISEETIILVRMYNLVGGWTNPFEKYARQIGSSPQVEVKMKNLWVATT